MGRKKRYGLCYLCGKRCSLSRDHVPPECFAPEPLAAFTTTSTSRFQYAWSCEPCNKHYGDMEKSFKNIMLMAAGREMQSSDDAWNKVISEHKKAVKQHGVSGKGFRDILQNFPEREIYTPAGIYLGRERAMVVAPDSYIRDVCIKIARGLHVIHTGVIIPDAYEMIAVLNEEVVYFEQFDKSPFFRFDTDFFQYYGSPDSEDHIKGMWYMRFYLANTALVCFRPRK